MPSCEDWALPNVLAHVHWCSQVCLRAGTGHCSAPRRCSSKARRERQCPSAASREWTAMVSCSAGTFHLTLSDPAPNVLGVPTETGLESRINGFTSHYMYDYFSGTTETPPSSTRSSRGSGTRPWLRGGTCMLTATLTSEDALHAGGATELVTKPCPLAAQIGCTFRPMATWFSSVQFGPFSSIQTRLPLATLPRH